MYCTFSPPCCLGDMYPVICSHMLIWRTQQSASTIAKNKIQKWAKIASFAKFSTFPKIQLIYRPFGLKHNSIIVTTSYLQLKVILSNLPPPPPPCKCIALSHYSRVVRALRYWQCFLEIGCKATKRKHILISGGGTGRAVARLRFRLVWPEYPLARLHFRGPVLPQASKFLNF